MPGSPSAPRPTPFAELTPPPLHKAEGGAPLPPVLPSTWSATAILHPYSPPPANDPTPDVPFYQMCVANVSFSENYALSVQITGLQYGTWWYWITQTETEVSTDQGATWTPVDMGWALPATNWLNSTAVFFATNPLNWTINQLFDWWKQPVPNAPGTTWFWFNSGGPSAGLPYRLMFGAPPPSPAMGDPNQLAVFQNFSFTYFPSFEAGMGTAMDNWTPPNIPGLSPGNPNGWDLFSWPSSLGMSVMMTPVDAKSFPLPTIVYYEWQPDAQYRVLTDRAQRTMMYYFTNPKSPLIDEQACLYGKAPSGITPPGGAGLGFIYDVEQSPPNTCCGLFDDGVPIGQEPPDWPAVGNGVIFASIDNNPTLGPGVSVIVIGIVFPPSNLYPQGRYLWTWYSPDPATNGLSAIPMTFMESASAIGVGTSLALADYFVYQPFSEPVPAKYLALPSTCVNAGPCGGAAASKVSAAVKHAAPARAPAPAGA